MITLHHSLGARSFRPLWMLEELGLPYELKVWPFPPRVHRKDYLEANPLGTVPLMVDGAVRMTESAAICEYLVVRNGPTPLQVRPDEAEFGAWLNWLHLGEATLTFPQTLVLRYGRFEPTERRQPQVVADYTQWFLSRLRGVEVALAPLDGRAARDWLCADRFTAADVSVGYALLLADQIGLADHFKPAVQAYWQRLQQRPAFRRALAVEHQAALEQGVSTVPAPLTGA